MDPEDETGSTGQGQNLHDLHNYLSTFNKEIEPGDDVLSHMDVDGGVGDVGDLYSSNPGNSLQEPGEGAVTSQFSSGFYSEQGILDTPLSDESAQQIQNLVAETERDDTDMSSAIKQEVGSIDLETVQAQIASFGDDHLSHSISDMHATSISQGLIMTSLGDNLDPSAGKVIRIVSLGEDGQYLSLADGSQMQILNQDLSISSDSLSTSDGAMGSDVAIANTSSTHSLLTSVGATGVVVTGRGSIITTSADTNRNSISGGTQLVALQGTSVSGQPQLVALSQGTALTTEALQMSGLIAADGTINSDLGYQTITILPSELNQNGDMSYVLIMAPQEAHKDGMPPLSQVMEDLKQENRELSEELVEINGEMKRVLRVIPKKFIAANFGAQLMCDYCDYTSPKRYLLTRHMKSHSDERPHKCKECERGFKTPASLLNHINTHTGTRPHKCKTCEAAFTTSGELVRHIRYRHTFEKPHRCPNCDYASVELSKLKRHMRSHTGERPYKCGHCPYASPDTYKLKRHLRIHTGEKPYECDICHARFTQSNSLKAHKLIHSGNKPVFPCDLCPTTCGRKTDLRIHVNKLHSMGSPLECKKCGQVFSDRYSYKQHMRGHDVDKCFKCDQCDFVANTERTFDLHAAIHSNGKKFECDTCHNSFNLKQSLEKHKMCCQLGGESGVDSQSSVSRDKENKEEVVFSPDSSSSSSNAPASSGQLVCGPLASDTLHKNLLQDIKAGKLGDVPQVVIVHPDGSLEEISSKGDKLNLEDIFSALSSSGKTESAAKSRERSQSKGSNSGVTNTESDLRKQKSDSQDYSDDDDEEEEDEEEEDEVEETGETSQCEASTQAELESDTDSVDDVCHIVSSPPHYPKATEKERPNLMNSARSESMMDQSTNSNADTSAGHNTEASSDTIGSLLQNTSTPISSAQLSSFLPSSSDQIVANNQQFVMVKGYTCLNNDTTQPTLVNVAVDKDSLMKMFASLATSNESGMHLLTGDLESSIALSIENSQAAALPLSQLQLHHFGIISGVPGSLIVAANFDQNDDSSTTQEAELMKENETISANSKDILSPISEADTSMTSNVELHLKTMHTVPSNHVSLCSGISIFVESSSASTITQTGNTLISSPSSSVVSDKTNLLTEQLDTGQHTRTAGDELATTGLSEDQMQINILHDSKADSSVKVFLPEDQSESEQFHSGKCILGDSSMDTRTHCKVPQTTALSSVCLLADKHTPSHTDTNLSQCTLVSGAVSHDSLGCQVTSHSSLESETTSQKGYHTATDNDIIQHIPGLTNFSAVKEELIPSQEKQKRSNRKRTATTDADPSLVLTGKRVRKTLIKVSM